MHTEVLLHAVHFELIVLQLWHPESVRVWFAKQPHDPSPLSEKVTLQTSQTVPLLHLLQLGPQSTHHVPLLYWEEPQTHSAPLIV